MNPEVFTVVAGTTVARVLEQLRRAGPDELVRAYSVMVTDEVGCLRGVIPLTDLVRADGPKPVEELMDTDPVSVRLEDPMGDVAELFDRFNLLSLPVVDAEGVLRGVITVDDVVSWLREGEGREGRAHVRQWFEGRRRAHGRCGRLSPLRQSRPQPRR